MKFIDEKGHLKEVWYVGGIFSIIFSLSFLIWGFVRLVIIRMNIFSIFLFIVGILFFSFAQYLIWLNNSDWINKITFMSFKHWKNLLKVNPYKWVVGGCGPCFIAPYRLYFIDLSQEEIKRYKTFDNYKFFHSNKIIKVNFSYLDYLRFWFYQTSLIRIQKRGFKRQKQIVLDRNLKQILESTQKDINRIKQEADEQICHAKEEMENINSRWKEELKKKDKYIKLKL